VVLEALFATEEEDLVAVEDCLVAVVERLELERLCDALCELRVAEGVLLTEELDELLVAAVLFDEEDEDEALDAVVLLEDELLVCEDELELLEGDELLDEEELLDDEDDDEPRVAVVDLELLLRVCASAGTVHTRAQARRAARVSLNSFMISLVCGPPGEVNRLANVG